MSRYALYILSSSLPTVFKCRHSGSPSHQTHTGAHTFPPFMVMTWLATAATSVPGTAGVCQLHWAEKMLFQYTAQQTHWLLWCWQALQCLLFLVSLHYNAKSKQQNWMFSLKHLLPPTVKSHEEEKASNNWQAGSLCWERKQIEIEMYSLIFWKRTEAAILWCLDWRVIYLTTASKSYRQSLPAGMTLCHISIRAVWSCW